MTFWRLVFPLQDEKGCLTATSVRLLSTAFRPRNALLPRVALVIRRYYAVVQ